MTAAILDRILDRRIRIAKKAKFVHAWVGSPFNNRGQYIKITKPQATTLIKNGANIDRMNESVFVEFGLAP